jgi:hypothetical protein
MGNVRRIGKFKSITIREYAWKILKTAKEAEGFRSYDDLILSVLGEPDKNIVWRKGVE